MRKTLFVSLILLLSLVLFSGSTLAGVVWPPTPGSWITSDQDHYNSQPCGSGTYDSGYRDDYCGEYFGGSDHDDGCGCWQKDSGEVGIYCCDSHGSYGIRTCVVEEPTFDESSFEYGNGDYTINCEGSCTESTWYRDRDNDGYSDGQTSSSCFRPNDNYNLSSELTAISGDCNDLNPNVNPGETEVCNGVDDDCDGLKDEDFECVQNSVDCDSLCNLVSGGCINGNLIFAQTDWSGGKQQFGFGYLNKYYSDNGFVSVTGSNVGKIVFEPNPTGTTVGGYDSGWISILRGTVSCDLESDDMIASSSCNSNSCAETMVNASPEHWFSSCENAGHTWKMLYQRPTNPELGFPVESGQLVQVNGGSLTIGLPSPENVSKEYYVSVDMDVEGGENTTDKLELSVNGGAAQTGYDPNHEGADIWWSCYFPTKFSFNSGNNTIKFKAPQGSIHLDAYRITEEIPMGLPQCKNVSGSVDQVGSEGGLMTSIIDNGAKPNWGFLEWDYTKQSGETISLWFNTADNSNMLNGDWNNLSPGNGTYDLTAFTKRYGRFWVGVDGSVAGSPAFEELRICDSGSQDQCSTIGSSECTAADLVNRDCYSCEDGEYFDVNNMRYCFNYSVTENNGAGGGTVASRLLDGQHTYCLGQSFTGYASKGLAEFNDLLDVDERLENILAVKNAYAPNRQPYFEVIYPRGLKMMSNCTSIRDAFPVSTHSYLYADGSLGTINCSFDGLVFAAGNPAYWDENGRINDGWGDMYGAVCQFERTTPLSCNYCTGDIDPNSVICNGDDSGLSSNTSRTLVSACSTTTKCEYICGPGYTYNGGSCIPNSTECYNPTDPVYPLEYALGLDSNGLVSYWPLDEINASKTPNRMGGESSIVDYKLDPSNEVVLNGGKFSNGFKFDASKDSFVIEPIANYNNPSFSLSAWIKPGNQLPDTMKNLKRGHIVGAFKYLDYGSQSGRCAGGYHLELIEKQDGNYLSFRVDASPCDSGEINKMSALMPSDNDWYHVVATYNDINNEGVLYIDGVLINKVIFGEKYGLHGINYFTIGGGVKVKGAGYTSMNFDGGLDDVSYWNRPLSECEVKVLAKGPKACLEGCIGICGTKNKNYLASETDWPIIGEYCEYGVASATPSFPIRGSSVNWNCEINTSIVPCSASRNGDFICTGTPPANSDYILNDNLDLTLDGATLLVDINTDQKCEAICDNGYYRFNQTCVPGTEYFGVCGDRNTIFNYSENDWPIDSEYCATGLNNLSPSFPDQGSTVTWDCLGNPVNQKESCSASRTFDNGECKGVKPIGAGIITGAENYLSPTYPTQNWTYDSTATGDMNCLWKCDIGYTRNGNTCILETENTSDVNNIEYFKISLLDQNLLAEIQCSKNIQNTGISIIDESGIDINQQVIFMLQDGTVVINGNLDCNNSPTKYILKSSAYVSDGQYTLTATIKDPCNICSRTAFTFYEGKKESTIPDANILVVLLVILSAVFIATRKRI